MKTKIDIGVQALLGLIFVVFGANGFYEFLPMPQPTGDAAAYLGGLAASKFFFPVLKSVELVCGLLLLLRRFSALALVVLSPVVVQILLYHVMLDPSGLPMALLLVALTAYLGFGVYGDRFAGVLRP